MDKVEKALSRLTAKERKWVKAIFVKLKARDYRGLDAKKLKGRDDIFRVRKGDIRVIYRAAGGNLFVLAIERRSERTYRN